MTGTENRTRNGTRNGPENGTGLGTGSQEFELWRQDDNGNRFRVSRHPDRASAEAAMTAIEAGVQHKQLYFIIRGSSSE
ncbi:MAG: hypothetical protein HOV87_22145 [Catenulispora sp.]|nr:hypothetical protein [Catenulispora sp.]